MPPNQRLGPNDVNDLENGREPAIQLDEEKAVAMVSRTLPRLFRCNTISCCRSVAISASSRAFDLNGETKMARTNQRSPITRSAYAIRSPSQRDEVFGTHRPYRHRCGLLAVVS